MLGADNFVSCKISEAGPGPKGDTGARGPRGDAGARGQTGPKGPKGDGFADAFLDIVPDSEVPSTFSCWSLPLDGVKLCVKGPFAESAKLEPAERVTGTYCYWSSYEDSYYCSTRMLNLIQGMPREPRRCKGYHSIGGDESRNDASKVWYCHDCSCWDYKPLPPFSPHM